MWNQEEAVLVRDERLLTEISYIEPIAVHGLLGYVNLGDTFLACYFRWKPVKLEAGGMGREKSPAVVLIRPRCSVIPGGILDRWLNAAPLAERVVAVPDLAALMH